MVEGRQGDIFEAWRTGSYDVIVLFGHKGINFLSSAKGFNFLSSALEFDRPLQPKTGSLHLPSLPGDQFDGRPISLKGGGTFFGCADFEQPGAPDGLSDEKFGSYLRPVYEYCREHNLKRVICNGVQPLETDEVAWDRRASLLYEIANKNDKVFTTFMNMTDIFVRNQP